MVGLGKGSTLWMKGPNEAVKTAVTRMASFMKGMGRNPLI